MKVANNKEKGEHACDFFGFHAGLVIWQLVINECMTQSPFHKSFHILRKIPSAFRAADTTRPLL